MFETRKNSSDSAKREIAELQRSLYSQFGQGPSAADHAKLRALELTPSLRLEYAVGAGTMTDGFGALYRWRPGRFVLLFVAAVGLFCAGLFCTPFFSPTVTSVRSTGAFSLVFARLQVAADLPIYDAPNSLQPSSFRWLTTLPDGTAALYAAKVTVTQQPCLVIVGKAVNAVSCITGEDLPAGGLMVATTFLSDPLSSSNSATDAPGAAPSRVEINGMWSPGSAPTLTSRSSGLTEPTTTPTPCRRTVTRGETGINLAALLVEHC